MIRDLDLLKRRLRKERLDGLLVTKSENVSYLSGFSQDEACLLITQKKDFFITDFRFYQQAKNEIKDFSTELIDQNGYFKTIVLLIEKSNLKRIGFEAKDISYGQVSKVRDMLKKQEFVPSYDLVELFRVIKGPSEVSVIKKAIGINKAVLRAARGNINAATTEKDLAALIEFRMRQKGADTAAFDTIVLSGRRCSLPHGRPSGKRFVNGEPVMVDCGVNLNGYNSDLTRMFFSGKILPVIKKIYSTVRMAQDAAFGKIRPGVRAHQVDKAARDCIKKQGWGNFFGHALGHGIGREVHELPSISARSEAVLMPGMVFTVEPAIYLPGIGGVRIEDIVLVKDSRMEILSR